MNSGIWSTLSPARTTKDGPTRRTLWNTASAFASESSAPPLFVILQNHR